MASRLMLNLRDPKFHMDICGGGSFQETTINGFGFRQAGESTWYGTHGLMTTGVGDLRFQASPSASSPAQRHDTCA
ncbi:hypothetical protein AN958_02193 [Leucoagaricus sp. SymC.cos]|nr:hypothetical protein AN958_02193 [Leucoagaricus sp. SymC.cos]